MMLFSIFIYFSLWNQSCYVDLVLFCKLQDSGIISVLTEILRERGAAPIGELGKIVQKITRCVNLPGRLKDKWGGLKKYIESCPEEFVICSDHPFNPHVSLTRLLSADDREVILKGGIPSHVLERNKKVSAQKKITL